MLPILIENHDNKNENEERYTELNDSKTSVREIPTSNVVFDSKNVSKLLDDMLGQLKSDQFVDWLKTLLLNISSITNANDGFSTTKKVADPAVIMKFVENFMQWFDRKDGSSKLDKSLRFLSPR